MTNYLKNYRADHKKQSGATLLGMLFVGALIVFVAIIGIKMAPAYLEFFSIKKVLSAMQQESSLSSMSPKEIKESFDRRASIAYVTVVKGSDLNIEKTDTGTAVSVDYQVVKPIIGNVSVLLDFSARSDSK